MSILKKLKGTVLRVTAAFLVLMLTATSFAWFSIGQADITAKVNGTLVTEYFHCGSGTEDDPFVITRPIHYYHMTEFYQRLSNLGVVVYADKSSQTVRFGEEFLYFQIGCPEEQLYDPSKRVTSANPEDYLVFDYYGGELQTDGSHANGKPSRTLYMDFYSYENDRALMPIGTSEVPFIGNINGNGITVANLNITTTDKVVIRTTDGEGNEVSREVDRKTADVGVFGYIGSGGIPHGESESVNSALSNLYFDNVTIKLNDLVPVTGDDVPDTGVVHTVEDVHHLNGFNYCYAGLIAGHIITSASVTNVYVNNSTIMGGNSAAEIGFGYFGCVEMAEGGTAQTLGSQIATLRGEGDSAGFGGSVRMNDIYNRLDSYIVNGNAAYNITAETLIVDEVTGKTRVDSTTKSTTRATDDGESLYYYYDENVGSLYMFRRTGLTGGASVIYLDGINSRSGVGTKTVTTYTYVADNHDPSKYKYEPAILIQNGTNYMSVSAGTTLSATTNAENALKFVWDNDRLYTRIDGTKYYLNANGTTGVRLQTTLSTSWERTANDELKIKSGAYYLELDGTTWILNSVDTFYRIGDGTNFLRAQNGTLGRTGTESDATAWILSNPAGTTTIRSRTGENTYYTLGFDQNTHAVSLTSGSGSTQWYTDANGFYQTFGGEKHYLCYKDGTWELSLHDGTTISDGAGHYLTVNNGAVANATSAANALEWVVTVSGGTATFYTVSGNTKYYLAQDHGALTLQSTPYNWTKNGNSYYVSQGGIDFYLAYDNGWKTTPLSYRVIGDNAGHYLTAGVSGGTPTFGNSANEAGATHFYPDGNKFFYVAGGTTYYLGAQVQSNANNNAIASNSATLRGETSSANGVSWTANGGSLSFKSTNGNYVYSLGYTNGSWQIKTSTAVRGYYISDGTTYMTVNGTTIGSTEDVSEAAIFTNATGNLQLLGRNTYLRSNGGTLSVSTTASTWSKNGNNLYSNNYYLYHNGTSWALTNNTSLLSFSGYTMANDTNFLNAVSTSALGTGTSIADTTDKNGHTVWTFNNTLTNTNGNGTISTTIGGTTYYIRDSASSGSALQFGTANATTWTRSNSGNRFRVGKNGNYIWYRNSAWQGYTSNSGNSGTSGRNITVTAVSVTRTSGTTETDTSLLTASVTSRTVTPTPTLTVADAPATPASVRGSVNANRQMNLTDTQLQVIEKTVQSGVASGYETYYPLRINADDTDYTGSRPNDVSPKNTGYIVSGGNFYDSGSGGTKVGDIRVSSYNISNISNSYGGNKRAISDGKGHYLSVDADRNLVSTDTDHATMWTVSGNTSGTISTEIGGTTYYLSKTGTELTLSTTSISWTNTGNRLYYLDPNRSNPRNYYYIRYADGAWSLSVNTDNATAQSGSTVLTLEQGFSHIYTNNANGIRQELSLTPSGDTVYGVAFSQFRNMLNGQSKVYGLHFMNASVGMSNLTTASKAAILNYEYENFELPEDTIDFRVVQRGSINFFAGTYFSNNNAFFSLHKITRDPNTQKILKIQEISQVFRKSGVDTGADYLYKYTDGTYSSANGSWDSTYDSTPVFDTAWITGKTSGDYNYSTLTTNAVYYFEIPCNIGEYCLGSVDGKTGAYLIYLDIATNGGEAISSAISSQGNEIVKNLGSVETRTASDTVTKTILQWAVSAPVSSDSTFSVSVNFDKTNTADGFCPDGLYTIDIVNKTAEDLRLHVFLCDNDTDPTNPFNYAYQVRYTNGSGTFIVPAAGGNYFKAMATINIPPTGSGASEINYVPAG